MQRRAKTSSKPKLTPAEREPIDNMRAVLGAPHSDRLSDRTRAIVDKGITALGARIETLIAKIAGSEKYDRDDASHLAWLTKLTASVLTEVRKHDEAERQAGAKLQPAHVFAYLIALDADKRRHLARALTEDTDSVLG